LSAADSRFLLLEAPDENSLLRLEERVLVANEIPLRGITSLVPSVETQLENIALQQRLLTSGGLESYLHALGLDEFREAYEEQLSSDFEPLTIANLEGLILPLGTGGFIGCDATGCASWMGLAGAEPNQLVALESGVTVVDQVGGINRMLGRYREGVALMLVSGILAVLIFLGVALGWRMALNIVLVPTVASLLSLAVIGYTSGGYSIINLLALLLVIGVSLDYAIFRVLTPGSAQAATSLAISLSAMTSLLAFGMLALSRTPVISDFGQTIALGLLFALWLSWARVERRGG
jgi:predicted exporter